VMTKTTVASGLLGMARTFASPGLLSKRIQEQHLLVALRLPPVPLQQALLFPSTPSPMVLSVLRGIFLSVSHLMCASMGSVVEGCRSCSHASIPLPYMACIGDKPQKLSTDMLNCMLWVSGPSVAVIHHTHDTATAWDLHASFASC
jgi:hypothetical protein